MKSKFLNVRVGALALAAAMAVPMAQPVNCFAAEAVDTALGEKQTYIVGTVDASELTLDITAPLTGFQYHIDKDGNLTSQGMLIKSNTIVPINVAVSGITGVAAQTDIEGKVTNIPAPEIVSKDAFNDWNKLTYRECLENIALAIHKVDVIEDGEGNKIAGSTYTGTEDNTPLELYSVKNLPDGTGINITSIDSAFGVEEGTFAALDICNDGIHTMYGKTYLGNGEYVSAHLTDLLYSYEGFEHYLNSLASN